MSSQIEEFIFNVHGHGYSHGIEGRRDAQVINARALSTTKYSVRQKQQATSRPSLQFTAKELEDIPGPGLQKYVVVGLIPPGLTDVHFKIAEGMKRQAVGTKRPSDSSLIEPSTDELPLIAVTPITDEAPEAVKLFVLLDYDDGACRPYLAPQQEVFYFAEFRDEMTQSEQRKTSWNGRVRAISVRDQAGGVTMTKESKLNKARDTTIQKVVLDNRESFSNEILALTAAFALHRDPWYISEIKRVLQVADEDVRHRPLPVFPALNAFADGDHLDEQLAVEVVKEAASLWQLSLTTSTVLLLSQGIEEAGIIVEYRLLRGFLAYGEDVMRPDSLSGLVVMEGADLAREIRRVVSLTIGGVPARTSIELDQAMGLLGALLQQLKGIQKAGVVHSQQLKNLTGNQAVTDSLPEILAKLKDQIDTDGMRLLFAQAVRYITAMVIDKTDAMGEMLGKVINVLDTLRLEA